MITAYVTAIFCSYSSEPFLETDPSSGQQKSDAENHSSNSTPCYTAATHPIALSL